MTQMLVGFVRDSKRLGKRLASPCRGEPVCLSFLWFPNSVWEPLSGRSASGGFELSFFDAYSFEAFGNKKPVA